MSVSRFIVEINTKKGIYSIRYISYNYNEKSKKYIKVGDVQYVRLERLVNILIFNKNIVNAT